MLELHDVYAGYGNVQVLHGVNLTVPTGSVVALLGANGAGKTTTLKVIAGLMAPTRGTIRLDGRPFERVAGQERVGAGLCLIPEGRGIFRRLTVRENIAMFVGGRQVNQAVERAAATFPVLGERLGQVAGTMSGGQQQMLALSRALVTSPTVVLADELSMGLAPVTVDDILGALDDLRREGISLLLVEQYVGRALQLADYVYVMHKGRIALVREAGQCHDSDLFNQYMSA